MEQGEKDRGEEERDGTGRERQRRGGERWNRERKTEERRREMEQGEKDRGEEERDGTGRERQRRGGERWNRERKTEERRREMEQGEKDRGEEERDGTGRERQRRGGERWERKTEERRREMEQGEKDRGEEERDGTGRERQRRGGERWNRERKTEKERRREMEQGEKDRGEEERESHLCVHQTSALSTGTRINSEPDPAVLYEGSRLVLSCDVTVGAQLSYTWFFNRTKVMPSTSTWLRPTSSKLAVERVTVLHAGVYSCMTQDWLNENRSSSSQVMQVHVKVHLSQPRIAFSISKEADGYGGHVTCWTSRGSPPATFYLLLDGKEVTSVEATKSTLAKFPVAMVPGQDMGMAECLVKNEVQELKSRSLTLVVVLVGGHVQVEVEYLYGADSKMAAAQLHCLPSQGTFPSFSWLLNNSSLPVKADPWTHGESWSPRYAFVDGGRVLVLTKTRGGESGSYRCRVRDSFDDSSAWFESPDVQVRMIGPPRLYGPSVALDEDIVEFGCEVLRFPPVQILLQVFKQGDRSNVLAESTLDGGVVDFPMLISYTTHEGFLECVASVQNNSGIRPTVSQRHYLKVVVPVKGVSLEVQSGAVEIFEGKMLSLRCNVASGNHISFSWLLGDQPLPASHKEQLFINRTTTHHSGRYSCVARNQLNDTEGSSAASPGLLITVREFVSSPDISYTVLKQNSQNYFASVTCRSSRGTPPITFSVYNRTTLIAKVTSQGQHATFSLPLVLNRHLGWLQCQADNGDRIVYSRSIALQVESVDGPVTMPYEYGTGDDFSVTNVQFCCRAAKGTHLRFQWFLNSTLLDQDTRSFYTVLHRPDQRSVLLLPVDKRSTGTYHCQVSDVFDNTTAIQSEKMYLDKEVLNGLSPVVVAVVFSCFGLLLTCVFTCCCTGVIFRRSLDGVKSIPPVQMDSMVLAYQDDLDVEEYREDPDVLTAAGLIDSDRV
ncbi:hypothetical protein NHX12_018318 [Muraenolepis orangiensis]|uniref:Ig-like domain-containing protein n=1 Tax=Muraenolepis orangiensis TaxID=630683 RepID=A0A9Q0EZM1_9TELE|nr:hypothetical protein NHX12_018318 [Muraenolepis orangiensis]